VRRDKPWFGPAPYVSPITGLRYPIWPRSWEGGVVVFAFFVGLGLVKAVHDPVRGPIAGCLVMVACLVIGCLTWSSDPD
jgi:hypothetical protein